MAQNHAASGEVIQVHPLGKAFADSRSTALIKARHLELARIVLPAGKSLREHSVAGEMTLLCIEGVIEFSTATVTRRLAAGELVHVAAGDRHALLALADASALMTICLAGP